MTTWRTASLDLALERAVAIITGRKYMLLSSLCPATSRTTFRRKCWCRELLMQPSAISKLLAHPSRKQTWSKATPASVKARRRCYLRTTGCCATRCCVCDKSSSLNLTPLHLPEQMLFPAKVNTLPLACRLFSAVPVERERGPCIPVYRVSRSTGSWQTIRT